jgi:hypothetical protein
VEWLACSLWGRQKLAIAIAQQHHVHHGEKLTSYLVVIGAHCKQQPKKTAGKQPESSRQVILRKKNAKPNMI